MKRFAFRALAVVGILLVVLAGFGAWLLGTTSGTRFAWRVAGPLVPVDVTIDSVDGRLAGPLTLNGVAVRTPTLEVDVDRWQLEWRPRALLGGVVRIDSVRVSGVDATSLPGGEAPPDEPAAPFEPPERIALPVDVHLNELVLEDVQYRASEDAEPQVVERARLAGRWTDAEVTLDVTEARGPLFDVEADATLVPRAPYDVDARLDWTVRPPGYAEATGTTELSGNLDSLVVDQRIAAPYEVEAQLRVNEPLREAGLDGELDLSVRASEIAGDLPDIAVAADLAIDGPLASLEVAVQAEVTTPEVDTVVVALEAARGPDAVAIDRLELRHPGTGGVVNGAGRVVLGAPPRVELAASWSGLRWPLEGDAVVVSDSGELDVDGSLDDYTLALGADLTTPTMSGQVELAGTGTRESVTLDEIDAAVLDGRLAGRGSIRFSPSLDGSVELDVSDIDPGTLAQAWPGSLDGGLAASVRATDGALEAELGRLDLSGTLRERDFELQAAGTYADGAVQLETATITSGASTIGARGSIAEQIEAELSIDSDDLADLYPGLGGGLSLDGTLSGPLRRPRVQLEATGTELDVPDAGARIESLTLTADVDLTGEESSSLELDVGEGTIAGTDVDSLHVTGSGSAAEHALEVDAVTAQGSVALALDGSASGLWQPDAAWRFDLGTATLTPAGLDAWRLAAPSAGRVGAERIELERTCWRAPGEGELCLAASRAPELTTAELDLEALPLDYVARLATDLVAVEGTISAEASLAMPADGAPTVDATLSSTTGRLVPRDADDAAIPFGPLEGSVAGGDAGIEADLSLPITADGRLELGARIGAAAEADAPTGRTIDGRIVASIDDLAFVSGFTDQVTNVSGALSGDLAIEGTLGDPSVSGMLALREAGAGVPAANLDLRNVSVEISGDPAGDLALTASAESGEGSLSADGRLELAAGGPYGELSATGERFEVVNTVDARVIASPDLRVDLGEERIELTGSVRVPQARITPRATSENAVSASPDEVIVEGEGPDAAVDDALRPFYASVDVRLGDSVGIDAFGLTGTLRGGLEVTERPGEPTTGSGEVNVAGTYTAYGQELEVRRGRLLFAGGPLTRPGLDIEAVRRPEEDILVGARVRGTLERPELSLFSEPSMQQKEQLSYLVLGRPLQGTSSSEESALSRAALAMGLRGGNFVSERINESLGLDEFGIQTQPGQSASEASFVIGKYLAPGLYVSYGVGLFESVTTLNMRYTISERWRITTESSSEGSGGDIVYSIERSTY